MSSPGEFDVGGGVRGALGGLLSGGPLGGVLGGLFGGFSSGIMSGIGRSGASGSEGFGVGPSGALGAWGQEGVNAGFGSLGEGAGQVGSFDLGRLPEAVMTSTGPQDTGVLRVNAQFIDPIIRAGGTPEQISQAIMAQTGLTVTPALIAAVQANSAMAGATTAPPGAAPAVPGFSSTNPLTALVSPPAPFDKFALGTGGRTTRTGGAAPMPAIIGGGPGVPGTPMPAIGKGGSGEDLISVTPEGVNVDFDRLRMLEAERTAGFENEAATLEKQAALFDMKPLSEVKKQRFAVERTRLENQKLKALSDLKSQIARNNLSGSSFETNEIAKVEAGFADSERALAATEGESLATTALQELEIKTNLVTKAASLRTQAVSETVKSAFGELAIGADLVTQFARLFETSRNLQLELATREAQSIRAAVFGEQQSIRQTSTARDIAEENRESDTLRGIGSLAGNFLFSRPVAGAGQSLFDRLIGSIF